MRVVLDTNVLIGSLIAQGVCADLVEHCVLRHTTVSSEAILAELHGHLIGKFKYTRQEADDAVNLLRSRIELVTPQGLAAPVCRDADDDMILGTALAGNADCIVTGDNDLLVIQEYRGIKIIPPSAFAGLEESRDTT
jgi:putative PIN family toxin of toxin-antitoxin system